MRDECEHGSLRRSCEICWRDGQINELEEELAWEMNRNIDLESAWKASQRYAVFCVEDINRLTSENERLKGELAKLRKAASAYLDFSTITTLRALMESLKEAGDEGKVKP